MMWEVAVGGHFEAAHMLSDYNGKCHNLHGHSYRYEVSVKATKLTQNIEQEKCMVMDYGAMKEAIRDFVEEKWDHAVLFSSEEYRGDAEKALYKWACNEQMKRYVVKEGKTTSEVLAKEMHDILDGTTLGEFHIVVKLWETEKNYTTYGD